MQKQLLDLGESEMNWSSVSRLELQNRKMRAVIPLCTVKGKRGKKILITAGYHGLEHSGITIAYKLFDFLKHARHLNGEITIVPIVNVNGVRAETRGNPMNGKVVSACYQGRGKDSLSDKIALEIWKTAKQSDCVLDLHSAGYARYLQHAIFCDRRVIPLVRTFGFDFAIRRTEGKEGRGVGLIGEASRSGILACALELGGGHVVFLDDVESGLSAILNFLRSIECLPLAGEIPLTPSSRIYMHDARVFARSPVDGVVYLERRLGEIVSSGEALATCIDLDGYRRQRLKSPASGKVIYLRTKARIGCKETVAMILPWKSKIHIR